MGCRGVGFGEGGVEMRMRRVEQRLDEEGMCICRNLTVDVCIHMTAEHVEMYI